MGVVLSASHALIPLTNRKAAEAEINIITQKIKIAKSPSYGIFQCYVIVLGDRAPRELKISQNRNFLPRFENDSENDCYFARRADSGRVWIHDIV